MFLTKMLFGSHRLLSFHVHSLVTLTFFYQRTKYFQNSCSYLILMSVRALPSLRSVPTVSHLTLSIRKFLLPWNPKIIPPIWQLYTAWCTPDRANHGRTKCQISNRMRSQTHRAENSHSNAITRKKKETYLPRTFPTGTSSSSSSSRPISR